MSGIHQYISAVGSFQGVFLFFLLIGDRNASAAGKVLGLYCLTMGLAFILPFITFGVSTEAFRPLAAWLFFLPVMYGPLLYLYCSKVVFNTPFKHIDLLHLSPLIFCYVFNVDSILFKHEELRLWIVGGEAVNYRLWLSEYILFVVALGYFIAAAFLLTRYHKLAADNLSNFNPGVFRWLGILVAFFVVTILAKGVMAFSNFITMTILVFSDALLVLVMLVIALTQWKNPYVFQVANEESDSGKAVKRSESEKQSTGTGTIDKATRTLMFDELVSHVEAEKSYRNSELSLTKLAESSGLSTHQLSEVLNQHAGKNFNQFINEYRIKEVCDQLTGATKESILDIAVRAGFSSKSTFNTIFKKFVGLTPTQYRQQNCTGL